MSIAVTIIGGAVFSEIAGYFLHQLLHSEKVSFLSRGHMLHHLRDYSPDTAIRRAGKYQASSQDRISFLGGVGLEWFLPLTTILGLALLIFWWLGVPPVHQALFSGSAIVWGYIMFSYMHGSMHLTHFWMNQNSVTKKWYRNARRLHDIHHLDLSDEGRMTRNYGICFFWMDRILGTYSPLQTKFNKAAYAAAKIRYHEILKN